MYRFWQIFPGALAWTTLILMVLASRYFPVAAAVFIILFDVYWLFRVTTLSSYLALTFRQMRQNLKINWLERVKGLSHWRDVYHLIIFPMVDEPYEVVKETFDSLKNNNYPQDKFIVALALEERAEGSGRLVSQKIEQEYGHLFHRFVVIVHPHNLPGEVVGKGSNQAWATKKVKEQIIDAEGLDYEKILVSVFDVDTQIYPDYFGRLTHAFLTEKNPLRASYQPIPLFNNNIYQAPAFARIIAQSATYYQMMQQARPENMVTFSSHSMPFKSLVEVGFWDTNVVSEDSHIFWQCYIHYHGDWRTVPLIYPVSMDTNTTGGFWLTMKNVYKQQRRWAWGAENVAYMLINFAKDKQMKLSHKIYWAFHTIESFHSWAVASILIFALGWLPLFLGGEAFNTTLLSFNLPRVTQQIMGVASIGIAVSAILGVLLLPPRPEWFKRRHYLLYILHWVLLPITMILLGSVPALDAHTRLMLGGKFRLDTFWVTPKTREQRRRYLV